MEIINRNSDHLIEIIDDITEISKIDAGMIKIRNLIENALKFTFEGRVEFGYSVNEGKVEFFVSDTGTGIPADQQPRIFSRFFQVDTSTTRSYGGTGMGLSITKAYVELLGGKIWFTSQQGEGSVFRFTIPYERVGENGFPLGMVI